ncbi:Hypothetical protein HEAR0594 [Herminiimonas arsenicoxydans]|uniref:Uncharacterized protein n=1 Tax=Herminiimonas arsenicoxydans TaxID=204773 RepID=A4G2Q8_HERAR|nr:Hypothetical protein HEAR0594 [Herminiimonas arsenicoxydans]
MPSEYPYFDYTAGLEGDARYGWADMNFYSVARKWYVNAEIKIRLADIVGYPHESKEPRVFDQPYPFKELFTMQEGQIYGPIVCKKLADDFN